MARLMVMYGKKRTVRNTPFHPTLKIRPTGYATDHWQEQFFRQGLYVGSGTVRERNVEQAIAHYFSKLKRCGHVPVNE